MIDAMHQVALTCADLAKSTSFYRDSLGLEMIASFDPPGLAFFSVGNVRLSVQQTDDASAASSAIYFHVVDIDAAVENLGEQSIALERDPEMVFRDEEGMFGDAGEEEWMVFFRDPDGNLLAFVSRKKTV